MAVVGMAAATRLDNVLGEEWIAILAGGFGPPAG